MFNARVISIYLIVFIIITVTISVTNARVIKKSENLFPVSIIHINDLHARFEETNQRAAPCNPGEKCIGGYARLVTMVKTLLERRKDTNPIYLNAGDSFQGTLWYNIGRWNVTSHFLNLLRADAMTLGNHEFDHGIEGVVPFLEHINSPMVVANIDDSKEPTIQGKYNKSVIIERGGKKIGIIGVILQTTDNIANTGKLKFLNESEAVKTEAERLKREDHVDIIIVLSHCGLDVDRVIAKNAGPHINVIVGGHSHTFLYTGENPPGIDKPWDKYPVEVIQEDSGNKVLIVQASAYAKYVGDITVYFDEKGNVVSYEGAPIYLDTDVKEDPLILEELKPWKEIIDLEGKKIIGSTNVTLVKTTCNSRECNLGNLIADSMVYEYTKELHDGNGHKGSHFTSAAIGIINTGGIRTTLDKGDLTYAHLITTIPFENNLTSFNIRGKYLLDALEYSVSITQSNSEGEWSAQNMLQVSGLKVSYNVTKPIGQRVINAQVLCQSCTLPRLQPLKKNQIYRIVTTSFLSEGGDGYKIFREKQTNAKTGRKDIDVLIDYVKLISPVNIGVEGRIKVSH